MNTPPTMNAAPFPMAPIKSSRKQLNKLDIKPKKLLYNDADAESDSNESVIEESVEIPEKSKISEIKSSKDEAHGFAKHIEQNELDNEAEETKTDHSYNLRRRNKNPIQNPKQGLKKKITQKKSVDKENIQLENASTIDFSSDGFPLSQPDSDLSMKKKAIWLQSRRDIGIWIQCCVKNCEKWRFVEEFHDPLQVPKFWICAMNSDKRFSSCEAAQDLNYYKCEEDLISNKFNAGSIVWGKVNNYPWWPGIVDDCPETLRFYELKGTSSVPVKYHVTFFEKEVTRSWLTEKRVKPLKIDDPIQPVKKPQLVYKRKNYAEEVKTYFELAKTALPLSITERLEKFSFVSRYSGKLNVNPVHKRKSTKKQPCRIGVMKSLKKRKPVVKLTKICPANSEEIASSSKPNFQNSSQSPLPSCSKSNLQNSMESPLAFCSKSNLQNSSESPLASCSKINSSESPLASCSKPKLQASSELRFASWSKPNLQNSSKSPLASFSKTNSWESPFASCSKPNLQVSSESPLASGSKANLENSSEPLLASSSKRYTSSDPICITSSKPDLQNSSEKTFVAWMKSTSDDKFKLPALETNTQISFSSTCSAPEESKLSDFFEPSLPTQSATESFCEEASQSKPNSPLNKDATPDENPDSRISSPFGSGSMGEEMNRYFNELIENYDSFDPARVDEIDIEELQKRYNCNVDEELSTDSDEEENNKWLYFWESDDGSVKSGKSSSDSSASDCVAGSQTKSSRKSKKSRKTVLKRVDDFEAFIDDAIKLFEIGREKPKSPPPHMKAYFDKYLF